MIDLFGLGKGPQDPQEPAPENSPEPEAPAAPRGSHRIWAFLLVLDSLFVIVFGGAVGAKVFQYWRAPEPPVPPAVHRRPPAPKPAPPAEKEPEKAPAPKAAAEKAPAPAPKPAAAAEAKRVPKPTLDAAPKPHSAPEPEVINHHPEDAQKARPVDFRLHAPKARSVQLVGAFIVHGGRMDMTKKKGVWEVRVYLKPGRYRYFFAMDSKKMMDPENPRSERGASLVTVP
jgi:hypothetical protein